MVQKFQEIDPNQEGLLDEPKFNDFINQHESNIRDKGFDTNHTQFVRKMLFDFLSPDRKVLIKDNQKNFQKKKNNLAETLPKAGAGAKSSLNGNIKDNLKLNNVNT